MLKDTVIEAMKNITGISAEELSEAEGLDFVEEGILDSLAIVSLLSMLESKLGCTLQTSGFSINDFRSLNAIIDAVDANCDIK